MSRAIASEPLTSAPAEEGEPVPWCESWIERSGLPPAVCGGAITLGVLAAMLCAELLSGELGRLLRGEADVYKASEYRFSLIIALLLGYLPAAWIWTVRAGRRAFAGLRPVLRGAPGELDALAAELGRFDRRRLRWAGLAGIAVSPVIPMAIDWSPGVYGIGELNTASLGHRIFLPLVMWLVARWTYAALSDARRLVALSRERLEVDLLDRAPVAPLTHYGLRSALISLGIVSIVSLLLLDWAARPGMPWVLGLLLATALGLGVASLLLPLRGARAVILGAKRRELAWCRERIRRRRDALANGDAPADAGTLDELVAYHGLVGDVRAWPFDLPTLVRLALYLAIPLGSWLGGALVERLLDLWLP
jgi:hypothetical protein